MEIENNPQGLGPQSRARRRCIGVIAASVMLSLPAARRSEASDLPHLSPSEELARALKYTDDSSKSLHQPGQACANCNFYGGGSNYGPCDVFRGKSVSATGWCEVYAKGLSAQDGLAAGS